jgi:DNA-binding response OmpR family regulator
MTREDYKRLLIVEDDGMTRELLREILEGAGYVVTVARDGSSAYQKLQTEALPHMVVLDLALPGIHGMTLGRQIKGMGDIPIVIISGERSDEVIIECLRDFAEDYIPKPFNKDIVLARIAGVLRRFPNFSYMDQPEIEVDGHLSINFSNRRITLDGQTVPLTATESKLLHILYREAGHYINSEVLLARGWQASENATMETLRTHMSRLRTKMRPYKYILSEREIGYVFEVPDVDADQYREEEYQDEQ